MLPDFPRVRKRAERLLQKWVQRRCAQRTGIMQEIKITPQHEGHRMKLLRSDGSMEKQVLKKIGAAVRLAEPELRDKGLTAVLEAYDKAAAEMAQKQRKFFLKRLNETLEEAGQTQDAGGSTLDFELLLRGLEMVDIDFDENGHPVWPKFFCGNSPIKTIENWTMTNEQRTKLKEFTERKRLAWRDREGSRKLVN